MNNKIFISGCFSVSDQAVLDKYRSDLAERDIILQVRNLSGSLMHSAFDFANIDAVAFAYELIQSFVISGAYDVFKQYILYFWNIIKKDNTSAVPFTMTITGIPTINGPENIECQISEPLTTEEKELVIKEEYELARQIENHQFELLKRSQYYDALNVFRFDSQSRSFVEKNIAEEMRKIANKDKQESDSSL